MILLQAESFLRELVKSEKLSEEYKQLIRQTRMISTYFDEVI